MSLKIITYNVWHGLSGKGLLRFGELEPPGRKKLRYQLQIEELRHLDPDVLFLQEVNPLFSRAQFYASQLSMQETHELDQAGVEILGWGFPTNLKTGLCTLTKPGFGLEKLKGLKLSGPRWNWLSDRLSFQVAEFRCALISAIHWKEKVVLVVNVHLHHGPTMNAKLRKRLSGLVDSGRVSAVEARWVSEAMDKADQRRANELAKLISFLKDRSGLHEGIILAGDFNCEGAPLDVVRNAGFREVTTEGMAPTWDPELNVENHEMSSNLEPPIPYFGNHDLREFIKDCTHRPTHLDHIFVSENLPAKVQSVELVCNEARGGLIGSDHFGLMATLV